MLSHVLWTIAVCAPISFGLGWWTGKKGAANVVGDVKVAVQDVSKKV